jgi:hypothetical protein
MAQRITRDYVSVKINAPSGQTWTLPVEMPAGFDTLSDEEKSDWFGLVRDAAEQWGQVAGIDSP